MKNITELQKIIKKQRRRYFWKKNSTKENLEKAEKLLKKYKAENKESLVSLYEWRVETIKKYGRL